MPTSKKYTTLTLSFLIYAGILAVVLFLNYQWSLEIDKSTARLDASGETSDEMLFLNNYLNRRILNYIDNPNSEASEEVTIETEASIRESIANTTEYLDVIGNGGPYDSGDGELILEPLSHQPSIDAYQHFVSNFSALTSLIEDALSGDGSSDTAQLREAVVYSNTNLDAFYDDLDVIYAWQIDESLHYSELSKYAQLAMAVITVLYIILFLFYFIRQLNESDRRIAKAQREIDDIMRTVNEGLFLIDSDLNIGSQYSNELEHVLGTNKIANHSLDELLSGIISSDDLATTKEFIEQLFNELVKEKLVNDLNPLDRIKVLVKNEAGDTVTRYLSFNFSRVYENDKITQVLASVADITNEVDLEQRLEAQQAQSNEQMEMLTKILSLPTQSMQDFLNNANRATIKINQTLETRTQSSADLRQKVNTIAREVHSLKGEASALNLTSFITVLELLEDHATQLRGKQKLTGEDFIPLAITFEGLMKLIDKVTFLHGRISNLNLSKFEQNSLVEQQDQVSQPGDEENYYRQYFNEFAQNIAERNHKKVQLTVEGFTAQNAGDKSEAIKEITNQLLRNAIVHGIEQPQIREIKHKSPVGAVKIQLSQYTSKEKGSGLCLTVEDDGQGIDFERIKLKMVQDIDHLTVEKANKLSKKELLKYIFNTGFSTAEAQTEDAGRGLGLDIIKDRVNQLNARLNIDTKKDKWTRFTIYF